jgi:hypothetical protein
MEMEDWTVAEYDVDKYRLRFVESGRWVVGADFSKEGQAYMDDDTLVETTQIYIARNWADDIQNAYRKLGLPVPELDIVVFIRNRTEEHLSIRHKGR